MRFVRLGDVAEVRLGRQRSPKNHRGPDMRPYLRAANIGWDGLKLEDVLTMNFTNAEMHQYRLEPGDILLSEASGSAFEVGKPAIWEGQIADCAFQNTLIRVRPREHDPRYLLHYFKWLAASGRMAAMSRGVGIHHLGQATVSEARVPQPALGEQHRIVEILDHMDRILRCRQRGAALLDRLPYSVFGRAELTECPTSPLGELISSAQIGLVRSASQLRDSDPWEYVRMDAIDSGGRWRPTVLRKTAATPAERAKYSVEDGDLLLNTRNTRELVGKSAVYRGPSRLYNNNLIRLRFGTGITAEFVHGYLWSREGRQQLEQFKSGTTSVFAVYARDLMSLRVPVPSREVQEAYAEAVRAVERCRADLSRHEQRLDVLATSLRSRAFSGEL